MNCVICQMDVAPAADAGFRGWYSVHKSPCAEVRRMVCCSIAECQQDIRLCFSRPALETAVAWERAHANRKGILHALDVQLRKVAR